MVGYSKCNFMRKILISIVLLWLYQGCSQQDNLVAPDKKLNEDLLDKIESIYSTSTRVNLKSGEATRYVTPDNINYIPSGESFSFTNIEDGNITITARGLEYSSQDGGSFSLSPLAESLGGGSVTAGETQLDINLTFCITAGESTDVEGLNPFGSDNLGAVLGYSIDMQMINSIENQEEFDFESIFKGMALFYVFADELDGRFPIVDPFSNEEPGNNQGFAVVFDIMEEKFYLSSSGNIQIAGGTMSFTGKFIELDFEFEDFSELEPEDDMSYSIVSGSGVLNCN